VEIVESKTKKKRESGKESMKTTDVIIIEIEIGVMRRGGGGGGGGGSERGGRGS
jgi:hypothetical protein